MQWEHLYAITQLFKISYLYYKPLNDIKHLNCSFTSVKLRDALETKSPPFVFFLLGYPTVQPRA